ncbi:Alpha/Beta hydrolase protein [Mycena olivaceomarginata]|uniref:Alpha/Beta hydrolase protein n=1 Tax=Mycena albidolilacea TaxID=1033008 RepID=A0AAD7ERN5_9AGAR|nr:Alpha/Beta hydrolase protein [Mycena albidolilacea]KAJ7841091.1 Alpha/Beta hydrolase protein [Mycena olivaceomarginata]
MLNFKLPGLPSLDQIINQSPLAQAAGVTGAALLGVADKPTVTQAVYDDLVHYFKYASTAYAIILPGPPLIPVRPNGQKLCAKMFDLISDTHGYVARDDTRKEIVVAFRGTVTPANFITDALGMLVDWDSTHSKVVAPAGTKVHFGFQKAWSTVSDKTLSAVTAELAAHPGYTIVVTGHSLGGALASLAGITLQMTFPTAVVKYYTYGQPRTGNITYATWVNTLIGPEKSFRVVHSNDGVPTMAPEMLGFVHHSTEYWALSPHSPQQTRICNAAGLLEDPMGSKKIPTTGINPAHLSYFGIFYMTPYLI